MMIAAAVDGSSFRQSSVRDNKTSKKPPRHAGKMILNLTGLQAVVAAALPRKVPHDEGGTEHSSVSTS